MSFSNLIKRYLLGSLWQDPVFPRLWGVATLASFAEQISTLALPLTAAVYLQASSIEMGLLVGLEILPFTVIGLFVGVWVDRSRKLPLMLNSYMLRTGILAVVPLCAWLNHLSMEVLYCVAFGCGVLNVLGGAASQVYMVQAVGRERLIEARSKLALSSASSELVGPGLAGNLVHWVGAPFALTVDALGFLWASILLRKIRDPLDIGTPKAQQQPLWTEMKAGLRLIWQDNILRTLAWSAAIWQWLDHMVLAVLILYATRTLAMSPSQIGIVYASAGIGCLASAMVVEKLVITQGVGRILMLGVALIALGWLGIASILGSGWMATGLMAIAQLINGFGRQLYFVSYLSLRQAVTPDHFMGRITATMRFLSVAIAPLGAALAGLLGEVWGLRATLWLIGGSGVLLAATLWTVSNLRSIRKLPQHASNS